MGPSVYMRMPCARRAAVPAGLWRCSRVPARTPLPGRESTIFIRMLASNSTVHSGDASSKLKLLSHRDAVGQKFPAQRNNCYGWVSLWHLHERQGTHQGS